MCTQLPQAISNSNLSSLFTQLPLAAPSHPYRQRQEQEAKRQALACKRQALQEEARALQHDLASKERKLQELQNTYMQVCHISASSRCLAPRSSCWL